VPAYAGGDGGSERRQQQQRCAREFHAAVVEDNVAYHSRDAERYEPILNPRMIFWYDGVATYGRDAIMATARQNFAVPGWVWTYEIFSETVYGCGSGIAVLKAHSTNAGAGTDREVSGRLHVAVQEVGEHAEARQGRRADARVVGWSTGPRGNATFPR
jgi:hypothetical protein